MDEPVTSLTFSSDGKILVTGCKGKVRMPKRLLREEDIETEKRGVVKLFELKKGPAEQRKAKEEQPAAKKDQKESKEKQAQPKPQPAKSDQERMVGNWFIMNDDSMRKGEMWVIDEDRILMNAKNTGPIA